MSGSSLDGVDLCLISFKKDQSWDFKVIKYVQLSLSEELRKRLKNSENLNAREIHELDIDYGFWLGNQIKTFLANDSGVKVIGIHGHTVFHDPKKNLSIQIGNGEVISHVTGLPTVDTFRIKDILHGGQGAPLVPIGDCLLFPDFQAWVNLGGIANITVKKEKGIMAWDIAPCNQVLNFLAGKLGHEYDKNGTIAASGHLLDEWLNELEKPAFFHQTPPKSLDNQWVKQHLITDLPTNTPDALHTYCFFLSKQIHQAVKRFSSPSTKILFTGGGANNLFLIDQIKKQLSPSFQVIVPDKIIIDYKEAIIFGFLGLLRFLNQRNVLGEATGSNSDTISGVLHIPD